MTEHHVQNNLRRNGIFDLQFYNIAHTQRKSDASSNRAGADVEAPEDGWDVLSLMVLSLFIEPRTTSPGMAPPTMG